MGKYGLVIFTAVLLTVFFASGLLGSALKKEGVSNLEMRVGESPAINLQDTVASLWGDTKASNISPFYLSHTKGYEIVKAGNVYHVYMSQNIVGMSAYTDLVRGLRSLSHKDTVVMHMANFGGFVHSGVQIINAMNASNAKIVVEVEGPSYSMGALISCAADEVILHPYTFLMFHHYSGGFSGKGSESRQLIEALDELSKNLMRKECVSKGILTDRQVDLILEGVDVYVHPHLVKP